MGRYVFTIKSEDDAGWAGKYSFAEQCSNFGDYISAVEYAGRYIGEDGEFIWISGYKDEILKNIDRIIKNLEESKICMVCMSEKCCDATIEMFKSFREFIESLNTDFIDVSHSTAKAGSFQRSG